MRHALMLMVALWAIGVVGLAQQRAPSPDGHAATEMLGHYEGVREPFYVGGRWIEISYGRPIKRGRDLWGSESTYGSWLRRGAPVWRAGADISTYLMTQAQLTINGTTIDPGGYSMFIDLAPGDWTLIVSNWQPQRHYTPSDQTKLWGAYGYTPDKDVVRAPMTVTTLPFSMEQLTWAFVDVTEDGGKIAIMWDRVMATVPFTARAAEVAPDPGREE